jgi:hypothetical protein
MPRLKKQLWQFITPTPANPYASGHLQAPEGGGANRRQLSADISSKLVKTSL